jgi:hypothetical protein
LSGNTSTRDFQAPRFDRPALDQMRKHSKTNLFDVIYFLDADRIALELTIQMITVLGAGRRICVSQNH